MFDVPEQLKPLARPNRKRLPPAGNRPQVPARPGRRHLVTGDRNVWAIVRMIDRIEPANPSTYHRLFSHRRWTKRSLYRSWCHCDRKPKANAEEGRRHRTPARLAAIQLRQLILWFPERTFVFAGDNAYGNHPMARFVARHGDQLTMVSKLVADANLFTPPPPRRPGTKGRPRVKGNSLPSPREVAAAGKGGSKIQVNWNGGSSRRVRVYSRPITKDKRALVQKRQRSGGDPLPADRSHHRVRSWRGKTRVTFSDMFVSVRRYLWVRWVFEQVPGGRAVLKLSPRVRKLLDFGLSQAA